MAVTCPRRMQGVGPWKREEGLDDWASRNGLVGQDQVGLSCTFCGSLHPDRFMELVQEGWLVGPTDKSYKAYLQRSFSDEEKAQRKAGWLATESLAKNIREAGARDGKTAEEIDADLDQYWTEVQIGAEGTGPQAKFYYQHLSEEQRAEFIEVYNARRMKIAYPGRFYVMPFFCSTTG